MPRQGVLILECLDRADPGSEGQFLLHMFNLMEVDAQYIEVRTKRQLLSLLDRPPFQMVHITTHGSVADRGSMRKPTFRGLWSRTDDLRGQDLKLLQGHLRRRAVVSTACMSGSKNFAREFVRYTGCDFYIAPRKSPTYATAIFFAHIFYHKYFRLRKRYQNDIPRIVKHYADQYTNTAKFRVFWPK